MVAPAVLLTPSHSAVAGADERPGKFAITTGKTDDAAGERADTEKTIFVVDDPSGISRAVIERTEDARPDAVVRRLHLKDPENFRAPVGEGDSRCT